MANNIRRNFKPPVIDPNKEICEHFTEINVLCLKKYNHNSFGRCKTCRNKQYRGYNLNFAICLTCGFQGCIRPQLEINHSKDHFKANPDHSVTFLLSTSEISCYICNKHFDSKNINLGKFVDRVQNFCQESSILFKNAAKLKEPPGIQNIGLTCYANSVLQVTAFYYMASNPLNVLVTKPLGNIGGNLCQMFNWFNDPIITEISPVRILEVTRRRMDGFGENRMHDSHEFLLTILNGVSLEIKEKVIKIIDNNIISSPENMASNKFNTNSVYRNSVPEFFNDTLFHGKLLSEIVCTQCQAKNYSIDTFLDLSLPIKLNNKLPQFTPKYFLNEECETKKSKKSKTLRRMSTIQNHLLKVPRNMLPSSFLRKTKKNPNQAPAMSAETLGPTSSTLVNGNMSTIPQQTNDFDYKQKYVESKSLVDLSTRFMLQIGRLQVSMGEFEPKTPDSDEFEVKQKIQVPTTRQQFEYAHYQNMSSKKIKVRSHSMPSVLIVNSHHYALPVSPSFVCRSLSDISPKNGDLTNLLTEKSESNDSISIFYSQNDKPKRNNLIVCEHCSKKQSGNRKLQLKI
ncbi:hypothetical protein MXB_5444 [Myxobolus squamalis]|nr:hypothetical protein MXB_5444 [Myxobolus squamalis]